MPESIRILILLGILCGIFVSGYAAGVSKARTKARAELLTQKMERAEEQRNSAEAYGKALADIQTRYEAETARGNKLEAGLAGEKKRRVEEVGKLRRRIADAARNSAYVFSSAFVRLYNQAIGIPADSLPQTLCSSPSDGRTRDRGTIDPWVLENGVTEADLLAHMAKYGMRCRALASQVRGWQALARGNGWAEAKEE